MPSSLYLLGIRRWSFRARPQLHVPNDGRVVVCGLWFVVCGVWCVVVLVMVVVVVVLVVVVLLLSVVVGRSHFGSSRPGSSHVSRAFVMHWPLRAMWRRALVILLRDTIAPRAAGTSCWHL